jgi:hypothetical protein
VNSEQPFHNLWACIIPLGIYCISVVTSGATVAGIATAVIARQDANFWIKIF